MKNTILIISTLIFLVPTAQAFTFINIYIDESGNALFLGETDETPILPRGIIQDDGKITGTISTLTNKQGEIWEFSLLIPKSEINVILPEGATIKQTNAQEILLDGKKFSLYFQDNVKISYSITRPKNQSIQSGFLIITPIILLTLIFVTYAIYHKKKKERELNQKKEIKKSPIKKKNNFEILKQVLNEREKLILEKLRQTGKIKSSFLRKAVDIPKASFSRHIQELEKKSLIKRSGEGKNKFIETTRRI